MSADDLSKPLGQGPAKRRRQWPVTPSKVLVVALSGFLGIFAVWALISDNPFGGEPMVAVPVDLHAAMVPKKLEPGQAADAQGSDRRNPGPAVHPVDLAPAPPIPEGGANTRTVTIIDGKTGTRQDVVIPVGPTGAVSERPEAEQKFAEMTPRGQPR